jgi:hypothetical protein
MPGTARRATGWSFSNGTCRDKNGRSMVRYIEPGDFPDALKVRNLNSDLCLDVRGSSDAMVAVIGTGDAFSKGRDFAAWLGLVPKQISPSIALSWATYRSAVTATSAFYSCKQRGSCSSSQ